MNCHFLKVLFCLFNNVFESEDWAFWVSRTVKYTMCQIGAVYMRRDIPSKMKKTTQYIIYYVLNTV